MTRGRRVRSTWFGVLAAALMAGGCGADEDGQGGGSSSSGTAGSANTSTGGGGRSGGAGGSTTGGGGGGGGGGSTTGGGGGSTTGGGGGSTTGGGGGGGGGNTASNEVEFGPNFGPGAPIRLGVVAVGSSRAITLTVRNDDDVTRTISGVAVGGEQASDFHLDAGTCHAGKRLLPSEACAVTVTFAPTTRGVRRAAFSVAATPCCGRSIQLEGGTRPVPGTPGPATSTPDATTKAQPGGS